MEVDGIGLKENEMVDDLQFKGLKIIQGEGTFKFGMDAVLLSYFAAEGIRKKNANICDLGTGTGILPILLWGRKGTGFYKGIEIQDNMADMASRSISLNRLESTIEIINMDLKNAPGRFGHGSFDYVVSNPPYKKAGSGSLNISGELAAARHEGQCLLEDVIKVSSALLRNGGAAFYILPSDRLAESFETMKSYRLEPKRLRMVHSFIEKSAHLFLIEASKCGKPGLICMQPLIIYEAEGQPTEELDIIYHRKERQ